MLPGCQRVCDEINQPQKSQAEKWQTATCPSCQTTSVNTVPVNRDNDSSPMKWLNLYDNNMTSLVHFEKCHQWVRKSRIGPLSNERRLCGLLNYISFDMMWMARSVYVQNVDQALGGTNRQAACLTFCNCWRIILTCVCMYYKGLKESRE